MAVDLDRQEKYLREHYGKAAEITRVPRGYSNEGLVRMSNPERTATYHINAYGETLVSRQPEISIRMKNPNRDNPTKSLETWEQRTGIVDTNAGLFVNGKQVTGPAGAPMGGGSVGGGEWGGGDR